MQQMEQAMLGLSFVQGYAQFHAVVVDLSRLSLTALTEARLLVVLVVAPLTTSSALASLAQTRSGDSWMMQVAEQWQETKSPKETLSRLQMRTIGISAHFKLSQVERRHWPMRHWQQWQ